MTQDPRHAQTFIAGEIDGLERVGVAVAWFVMDPPDAAELAMATQAAAVMCVSDFTRGQLLLQAAPATWPKAHVGRCGIDLCASQFASRQRRDDAPTIVAIRRLSAEKGVTVLLDAMVRLRDEQVAPKLELLGYGPERGMIEAAIAQLSLADRVTLAGELPPEAVRARRREADCSACRRSARACPCRSWRRWRPACLSSPPGSRGFPNWPRAASPR